MTNTKQRLRTLLTEGAGYDFGCVLLNLDVDSKDWNKITDVIDKDDLYMGPKGEESKYGIIKHNDIHITALFGIHADVPDKDVDALVKGMKKPKIELKKCSTFTNGKDFDVIKFDIESKDLNALNKKLCDNLPYTTDHPKYHAHCSIAYVLKGKAAKYVKLINAMQPLDVEPDELEYSKPNGKSKKYKL